MPENHLENRACGSNSCTGVLVVDDLKIMRESICQVLDSEPALEVVGQAADGQEAVRLVEDLAPDVVVMDVSMPRMNGVDATLRITRAHPEIRVFGLSMHDDPGTASRMLEAGAEGFLSKLELDRLCEVILERS